MSIYFYLFMEENKVKIGKTTGNGSMNNCFYNNY